MGHHEMEEADNVAWLKGQRHILATLPPAARELWNAQYERMCRQTFSLGFAYGARFGFGHATECLAKVLQ